MSNSGIRWLGSDIQIDDRPFCHGDNGTQEFYETIIASQGILLGTRSVRNRGEDIWIAYATQGQAIRTLTGCSHRTDGTSITRCKGSESRTCHHGKIDAEPLYGTTNDPRALAEGLIRLWQEHGANLLSVPCKVIAE